MLVDMAGKKLQENTLPNEGVATDAVDKQTNMPSKPAVDKPTPAPPPVSPPRVTVAGFMKMEPNDPYRRLLPAVLFVLTFVTVMSMLLIYMDNVVSEQQFRLNMSRDYELARIPQESASLVAYVRQLHLAPRPPLEPDTAPETTPSVQVLDRVLGELYNGTYVEVSPAGGRSQTARYLERARGWGGVCVRAAARDFLTLRAHAAALHACLSPSPHPREVSYPVEGAAGAGAEGGFRSRVLCLPLYTVLLAARATAAHYLRLAGGAALPALTHVPYHNVTVQVIEVMSSDPHYRNDTTNFLATKNYTVAASFPHSVMYALNRTSM